MDVFKMKCLVRAAETLNYSQAAREMYISQSAITQQVASAEKEFDVKIFEKDGKNIYLTEAGQIIIAGFRNILSTYDSMIVQAQRANQMTNELRIGYHGPMNWGTFPALLAEFKERMPQIRLSVCTDHWVVLVQDLNQGSLDLVFTEAKEMERYPHLTSEYLFQDIPCVCMSPKNPLCEKPVLFPADLERENLIMTNSIQPSISMSTVIDGFIACGIDMQRAQIVHQPQIAVTMAAANIGVTFIPASFRVEEYSNVVFKDLVQDLIKMDMVLAYSEPRLSKAGHAFIQLCRGWNFQAPC
ncbi:MAG: LysR family transcriptional regulator [Oscillospiraceae bacterium]|nr:LysR family transcriptional regulator [Oscillospiraceae bacterium]